jgi:hypothetical protein
MINLPIVVIGQNRTIMTQHVIKRVVDGFKNIEPYIIHVSDRSYTGHTTATKTFLDSNNIPGCVLETTNARLGYGGVINIGIEEAIRHSDYFFIMDNDWYLREEIDITTDIHTILNSPIACISYKHISNFNNVDISKLKVFDSEYLIKLARYNNKTSYNVELGCFLCHKRLFETIGYVIENDTPDNTEMSFLKNHQKFSTDELINKKILSANNSKYLHKSLNDSNCVFYHIGKNSTRGGIWSVPKELLFLSNVDNDIIECKKYM